ncbi:MAG: ribonuclease HI [Gammaproteobacteria bacterium]|nr:ribonuclease HI [Gammaproteobacteria bacterium]MDE0679739.1 ribonuclease HI [Gammaproteobacteria bacterium]
MQQVEIYTDGACSGNPGPGGWAALLRAGNHEREISGAEPHTTNNRMELTAALRALEALKRPCRVVLHTDSTYVQKGMKGWLDNWKRNGWKTANKKPVRNEDLWRDLDKICARHSVEWRWVRGHAGNPGNERADMLAREAMNSLVVTGAAKS